MQNVRHIAQNAGLKAQSYGRTRPPTPMLEKILVMIFRKFGTKNKK